VKFGGHELAAGLSVTRGNLSAFRKMINEYADENLDENAMIPTIEADCEVPLNAVNIGLAEDLQILEPYGVGNPIPNFVMYGVNVNEIAGVSEGKHTRLSIGEGKHTLSAMYFSNSPSSLNFYNGDKVDLLFNVDINEWMGRRSVQLIVKDVKPSTIQGRLDDAERERFNEIWNGAHFTKDEDVLPTREDFAAVYRHIANTIRSSGDTMSHKDIVFAFAHSRDSRPINYIKLKIIIKVFQELNLIGIEEISPEIYRFSIHYTTSKSDLEKSCLLKRIRSQVEFK
jgi:single-stranded-DNA-specific exonuclease